MVWTPAPDLRHALLHMTPSALTTRLHGKAYIYIVVQKFEPLLFVVLNNSLKSEPIFAT